MKGVLIDSISRRRIARGCGDAAIWLAVDTTLPEHSAMVALASAGVLVHVKFGLCLRFAGALTTIAAPCESDGAGAWKAVCFRATIGGVGGGASRSLCRITRALPYELEIVVGTGRQARHHGDVIQFPLWTSEAWSRTESP